MVIGFKDAFKLIGIMIVAVCAAFVCTLFCNYNIDLKQLQGVFLSPEGAALYKAQTAMGKATAGVTGGCLAATSVVMLLFYVKNYIDAHGKEMGILKALGYSEGKIAVHFWVFGCSVLLGCAIGVGMGYAYMPRFYRAQNAEGFFPTLSVRVHPLLVCLLTLLPAAVFAGLAIFYAYRKLKSAPLDLLADKKDGTVKAGKADKREAAFLPSLRRSLLRGKKAPVFFIAFSAFCFSAMTQMAMSMRKLASDTFAVMIVTIGLVLAYTTLFLSLSSVVKHNEKTVAMMRVFGYGRVACGNAVFGVYRPFSYGGFLIGTVYQFALLKIMLAAFFADVLTVTFTFDFVALAISAAAFVVSFELVLWAYVFRIGRSSLKSVMAQ